jgi:DNA-binding MarR family transcriptional regulator
MSVLASAAAPGTDDVRAADVAALSEQLSRQQRLVNSLKTSLRTSAERSSFQLLWHLADGPKRTGALAEATHADPSTTSRHVADLVRRGMAERQADPVDGRACLIALTAAGQQASSQILAHRLRRLADMLADWPAEDVGTFARLLTRFNDAFDAAGPHILSGHDEVSRAIDTHPTVQPSEET